MKKVAVVSQARMTSSRLPGKVLKTIKGIPMLKYHADRVRKSANPLYIATTVNATDDPIAAFCEQDGICYYRGDEHHVLSRYYECAREHELDVVVRVTADCPLIDGAFIARAIKHFLLRDDPYLYLSNGLSRTIPRGFDFEIFSFGLLELAFHNARASNEIEHVTPYLYLDKDPRIVKESFPYWQNRSNYRVTLDTREDFELIKTLIENHDAHNLDIDGIVEVLDKHPELVAINAHVQQKEL